MRGLAAVLTLLLLAAPCALAREGPGEARKPNRLVDEASPYLRQHAYHPVDWYPWGREAFDRAARENKPIFLSVGYSTCHWCHVMARESYSNAEIAEILNSGFISIKVDRERRPDVDETYMLATQLIHRRGGWPNNVFLTPDRKPFYAGTYFPPDAFRSVLVQIAQLWQTAREALEEDGDRVAKAIETIMTRRIAAAEITPEALKDAAASILGEFDELNGGFSDQLKFPHESVLLFLLHLAEKDDHGPALDAATLTLDNMLDGGIQDHVGGGFHRYAVDPQWRVPHFEKMLYNQALITRALLRAHRMTASPRYAAAARRALDYVLADMTSPEGGFYSARDAESAGAEGTFYVWTPEQLVDALGPTEASFAQTVFGVTEHGNFEHGTTVLHFPRSPDELAREVGLDPQAFGERLDAIRRRLAAVRSSREPPLRDEKMVIAWNGMMIRTFAEAAVALKEVRYRQAAEQGALFMWRNLQDAGGLKRTYFEGRAALDGQQDDYAFAALAFVALYDLTGEAIWLERSEALAGAMVERFQDDEAGDFYMAASVTGFARAKHRTDGGLPSGNAAALELFAKLARRSRDPEHRLRGEALLAALSGLALRMPLASGYALMAADLLQRGETGPRRFLAKGTVDAKGSLDRASGVVTVRLAIAEGWHINADRPLEEFFVPTELVIEDHPAAEIAYPAAVRRRLAFHDKELALYEGTVELTALLPQPAAGAVTARLRLQACSDQVCLEPETVEMTMR